MNRIISMEGASLLFFPWFASHAIILTNAHLYNHLNCIWKEGSPYQLPAYSNASTASDYWFVQCNPPQIIQICRLQYMFITTYSICNLQICTFSIFEERNKSHNKFKITQEIHLIGQAVPLERKWWKSDTQLCHSTSVQYLLASLEVFVFFKMVQITSSKRLKK